MSKKRNLPWWFIITAKIILSRLPIPYSFWKKNRLFEHGKMEDPAFALDVFIEHANTADLLTRETSKPPHFKENNLTVLELGPGDSFFSALTIKALGGSKSWLVDAGNYTTTNSETYIRYAGYLREKGYPLPDISQKNNSDILRACNSTFLSNGTLSLKKIPTKSVDFIFSNAVLEHIPKNEFRILTKELERILKPSGIAVHRVDLKDHLGGKLNNLRFSESIWEHPFFTKSGFYTNRLRCCEIVSFFEQTNLITSIKSIGRWNQLPTPRKCLATPFSTYPDKELLISHFDLILRSK